MTTVLLIRHGEIENPKKILYGGIIDLPLSRFGKEQIASVARKLKDNGFIVERVYTSDLKRAMVSGKIIAKIFGIKNIIIERDIRDVYIPALVGSPLSIIEDIHKNKTDEYSKTYASLGNESKERIANRMKKALYKIVKENTGKSVIVVGHGDPIRILLYRLDHPRGRIPSMYILKPFDYPKKGECVQVEFDNAGKFLGKKFIFSRK